MGNLINRPGRSDYKQCIIHKVFIIVSSLLSNNCTRIIGNRCIYWEITNNGGRKNTLNFGEISENIK